MSQNPNGTYTGSVYNAGESNAATLIITSSDPQTGNITQASMTYYGYNLTVQGTFTYQNLSNQSSVIFNLQAQSGAPDYIVLSFSFTSPDRDYSKMDGTVHVDRGGPNVGQTYNVTFSKC